jgi:cellulose synthase/poly-beta-1,6-N-acetylglucosamine synthase-like glycosyltransferase
MIRDVIEAVLLAVAAAGLIPAAVLLAECVAALWPRRLVLPPSAGPARSRLAVIIPAHNEETAIEDTVRGARSQIEPLDSVLVVADNCSDGTASRARGAGAEVLERFDNTLRGKGYALAHGLRHLQAQPPDLVVFLDADTRAEPGAIRALRDSAAAAQRPVQAVYLLDPPAEARATDFVSSFAFLVKNLVRPVGLARLGVPCLLVGTGMAIPWTLIDIDRLATGNIVEDMQLGIDLAIAGKPPLLCLEARVTGSLPGARQAALVQRTRWEHGHLGTLLVESPRLAWQALRRGRLGLLAMAFDLCVPPLALFCLAWVLVASASVAWWLRGGSRLPMIVSAASGGALLLSVILAWARHARGRVPGRTLLLAPLYILWKIPVYLSFLFRRQKAWVRTPRDQASQAPP